MSIIYKESRNICLSIIYYIEAELLADGLNTEYEVMKSFKNVYDTELPVICVRNGIRIPSTGEIGSVNTVKNNNIHIDIFAKDGAGKSDMRDWLISVLESGCDYYTNVADNDGEIAKTLAGKLVINNIEESPINLNTDKSKLADHDKHRTLITITATTGKVS